VRVRPGSAERVDRQDVEPAVADKRHGGGHGAEQVLDAFPHLLRLGASARLAGGAAGSAGEVGQVRPLGVVELQCAGDRVQDAVGGAGAGGLMATVTPHLPLAAVVLSLFTMVSGVAVTTPPTTSLALAGYPDVAGTASSFLGVARFAFGGFAAPLVGLGGTSAVPLGVITVASTALAGAGYALTIRSRAASRHVLAPVTAGRSASAPGARVAAGQDAH
jgi:hypothetical protein